MISIGPLSLRAFVALLAILHIGQASLPQKRITIPPLKPVKSVFPVYPEELKEEGIAGEVAFWAGIDIEGNVRRPVVIRHLHPVLEALALEAVKQWKYEPLVYGGERVQFLTYISVIFDPGEPGPLPESSPGQILSDELKSILDRCAEYALRLDAAAGFFVCRERIGGTAKNIMERSTALIASFLQEGFAAQTSYVFPVLEGPTRISSVNDYQAVNKEGRFAERRIPISVGRSMAGDKGQLGIAALLPPLAPIAVPARLLAPGFRPELIYALAAEGEIRGRKCFVVEIKPKRRRTSEIRSATVWAEKESCRILRIEVDWAAVSLDEMILEECRRYHLSPHMIVVHDYALEKNGLLYPSRSDIRLEYAGLMRPPEDTRAKLDFRYDRYRFFSVESEPKIIR